MAERQSHPPGTPSWVDIGTDIAAAKAFYCPLMGWGAVDAGPVEETGGYGFFTRAGKLVAGFGPQQNPGPPYWSTYVSVADADETAAKVAAAGGTALVGPMDVMDAGRMAVFLDPQGVVFSIWQPGQHIGAQLVNEPGSLCWNELNTRDPEGSATFYTDVFGWTHTAQQGPTGTYGELHLGDRVIGGMVDMRGRVPDEIPAHWNVYFAVEDCDATLTAARELGGAVVVGPFDIPVGRFAVLRDPQGATFSVIQMNSPDR